MRSRRTGPGRWRGPVMPGPAGPEPWPRPTCRPAWPRRTPRHRRGSGQLWPGPRRHWRLRRQSGVARRPGR
eukprot:8846142-Alexandrium_andersonii.AAC.1